MTNAAKKLPVWRTENDLMDRLTKAQNSPAHRNHDIMTFAGFMNTREELESYVIGQEAA